MWNLVYVFLFFAYVSVSNNFEFFSNKSQIFNFTNFKRNDRLEDSNTSFETIIPLKHIDYNPEGGAEAFIKDFPYVVSIQKEKKHRCVGTLISKIWSLTAGHCLVNVHLKHIHILNPNEFDVVSGQTLLGEANMQSRRVKKLYLHSKLNLETLKNNIGIVEVDNAFNLNEFTNTVNISSDNNIAISTYCTIITWSRINGESSFSDYEPLEPETGGKHLIKMDVSFMTNEECKTKLGTKLMTKKITCVRLTQNKTNNKCPGDSGSPLICGGQQYGITSWSIGCKYSEMPAVFIKIASYRIWISDMMNHSHVEVFSRSTTYESSSSKAFFIHLLLFTSVFLQIYVLQV